jgi:hypothetical protein
MRMNSVLKHGVLVGLVGLGMMGGAREASATVSWHQYTSTSPPTVEHPSSLPIGGNGLIAVTEDALDSTIQDVEVLTTTSGTGGYRSSKYFCTGQSPYVCAWTTGSYYEGITASGTTTATRSDTYSWTSSWVLYQNGTSFTGARYNGLTITDVHYDKGDTLSLQHGGTTCNPGSSYPAGSCIEEWTPGSPGSWSAWYNSAGASQIVQDAVAVWATAAYVLDSSGAIWSHTYGSGSWAAQSDMTICGGAAFVGDMIAMNDLQLYVIIDNGGAASDVYELNSTCFQQVATPPPKSVTGATTATSWALSITAPIASSYSSSNGLLWATDVSGNIWYLE